MNILTARGPHKVLKQLCFHYQQLSQLNCIKTSNRFPAWKKTGVWNFGIFNPPPPLFPGIFRVPTKFWQQFSVGCMLSHKWLIFHRITWCTMLYSFYIDVTWYMINVWQTFGTELRAGWGERFLSPYRSIARLSDLGDVATYPKFTWNLMWLKILTVPHRLTCPSCPLDAHHLSLVW